MLYIWSKLPVETFTPKLIAWVLAFTSDSFMLSVMNRLIIETLLMFVMLGDESRITEKQKKITSQLFVSINVWVDANLFPWHHNFWSGVYVEYNSIKSQKVNKQNVNEQEWLPTPSAIWYRLIAFMPIITAVIINAIGGGVEGSSTIMCWKCLMQVNDWNILIEQSPCRIKLINVGGNFQCGIKMHAYSLCFTSVAYSRLQPYCQY